MAQGVYRTEDAWVMVDFDYITAPMPKWRYEESGIQPPFSQLPLPHEYFQASREAKDRIPSPSSGDGAMA